MIQHRAARFVLNKPWRKTTRDSITHMLKSLKWPTLEKHRENAHLLLLLKLVNNLLTIPTTYMPTLSPLTGTRPQHYLK